MLLSVSLLWLACAYALYIPGWSTKSSVSILDDDFDSWISSQSDISFKNILQNIGGVSPIFDATEVFPGVVVASPSRTNPNYFYQWTRDSALTIRSLIYWIDDHQFSNQQLVDTVEKYIEMQYHLQRLSNPSGNFDDPSKKSLGEPKFHTNGEAFTENWGRPQSDGPGLRVSSIFNYFEVLKKYNRNISNKFLQSEANIYSQIVKNDLLYIVNNWNLKSFDLWEEINSFHFFNSLTQLRALKDGMNLVLRYELENTEFISQLQSVFDQLKDFILYDSGFFRLSLPYIVETPSLLDLKTRRGLDAATLLASIHSHNLENTVDYSDIPFEVDNNYIINTVGAMVADMKYRYPINHDKIRLRQNIGVGLGRYPEDIYDGYGTSEGNPWFISTASAAEVLYKTVYKLIKQEKDIVITSVNREFFLIFLDEDLEDGVEDLVIPNGLPAFDRMVRSLFSYADSFLQIIKEHVDTSGSMLEQFNKYHGFMQGANNLTWSYSSFYNSVRWRNKALEMLD